MSNNDTQSALDIKGAATLIGVTPSALRKWKASGDGPPYYKAGHALRYRRDAVLRWIANRTVHPNQSNTA